MHDDEVAIDTRLVERLVAAQFPWLSDLPVRAVQSTGTVNAIYRLGEDMCARLPRVRRYASDLAAEWRWLPVLAPRLSLQVPEPVVQGTPESWFPFPWAIYRWIDGQAYTDDLISDECQAATDLARFVAELRQAEVAGAPPAGRRPLAELDAVTRQAIHSARNVIDQRAASAAWELALQAPAWQARRSGFTPTC